MSEYGEQLIARYCRNYRIAQGLSITEEMIRKHWDLERYLAGLLMKSTPKNRWEVFEACYTRLYGELKWLNMFVDTDLSAQLDESEKLWVDLIGKPPKKIYEIGSGKGRLISVLANSGFLCTATEITPERGQALTGARPNLEWHISDGVHLYRFEPSNTYDVVISNNLVEHLHPDDILEHLRGVHYILKPGGSYILTTPHAHFGPHDISRIFGCIKPLGMHLHEYTYRELVKIASNAGFKSFLAVWNVPTKVARMLGMKVKLYKSLIYLNYVMLLECLTGLMPYSLRRNHIICEVLKAMRFGNIFLVCKK